MIENELFYRIAVLSTIVSAVTVGAILIYLPTIYLKTEKERIYAAMKSDRYKGEINRIWGNMKKVMDEFGAPAMRPERSLEYRLKVKSKVTCAGCSQLSCPVGPSGLAGPPGEDGIPGVSGNPGPAGDDGFDVELSPEDDLPCVICPAGPPGQRGLQGERGEPGEQGSPGFPGPPGVLGEDGPLGAPGPPGPLGPRGPAGTPGPVGDVVISGVGIKGPKGPPGPAGPKGPNGIRGKNSKISGVAGKPGEIGPIGPPGQPGKPGEEGPWGPPGGPGQPAAYCPSDCGVSEIFSPLIQSDIVPSNENDIGYRQKVMLRS